MVFFAGIHGNEPAGILALENVFAQIDEASMVGEIIGLLGNLKALEIKDRFISTDLNRLWTHDRMLRYAANELSDDLSETQDQHAITGLIESIIDQSEGPCYFFDLHTTSGPTIPFMTVNDSMLNRKFTSSYPVPIVLGIEEYLEGPLLSYINELGYVSFGFEGGQHDDPVAVKNHEAFIKYSLTRTQCIEDDAWHTESQLWLKAQVGEVSGLYEIFYRHGLKSSDTFSMEGDFQNFQLVPKGTFLARHNDQEIYADRTARIFMPRYQPQGDDGFFAIREIPEFFMRLSRFLRKIRFDAFMTVFPGVRRSAHGNNLLVDRRIARFFTRAFFHLLGYRSWKIDHRFFEMRNRETNARTREYQGASWLDE